MADDVSKKEPAVDTTAEDKTPAAETGAADKGAETVASGADKADAGGVLDIIGGGGAETEDADSDAGKGKETYAKDKPAGGVWPDDWRDKLAGGDEKLLKRLGRFAGPDALLKSWLAAEQKISSGEYAKPLPENPTEEQLTAWRQANGIPQKPGEYKMPDGLDLTDADKPLVNDFLERLHKGNAPQAIVDQALGWYADFQQKQVEAQAAADREANAQTEDALRAEFGAEFRPSLTLVGRFLNDPAVMGADAGKRLLNARGPDGRLLFHDPIFAKWIAGVARSHYGESAMIQGDSLVAINNREAEILKVMKEDVNRYWREGLDKELAKIRSQKEGRGRAA